MIDFDAMQALCAAATAGPWSYVAPLSTEHRVRSKVFAHDGVLGRGGITVPSLVRGKQMIADCGRPKDATFAESRNAALIAAARTFVPEALAEIRRLREALEEYGEHQSGCTSRYFEAGVPRLGEPGSTQYKYKGKWYHSRDDVPCECGLRAALNGADDDRNRRAAEEEKK